MPFGLTNAPSTFQALMNQVLKPYLRKFILVFFDDILVYSGSHETHREHLKVVLETLRQHELLINRKKCSFEKEQLEYLGHIISAEGLAADPEKIQAMTHWPIPKDLKSLQGFLGLTGYYRRFVRNYGRIAWPLTQLLKKDDFKWDKEAQAAFEELKTAMTTVPVLAVPTFSKPFALETDASGKGIGAVLLQEGRPVAYMSQKLSERNQGKSVYERELMAIVLAIQKWRHYLLGQHFIVYTDQKSLKFLLDQRIGGEEQNKWVAKLMGYDFEIRYKVGSKNKVADALSRKIQFSSLTTTVSVDWEGLEDEVQSDERLRCIIQQILQGRDPPAGFALVNGKLRYKGRMVISKNSKWIPQILQEFHDSKVGGHSGHFRTYKRISGILYWEGMEKQILDYVRQCDVCQRNKHQNLLPAGLLQPLPIPENVWSDISMDFIGGLPKALGRDSILVVVDRMTKYAHFFAVSHPYTAKEMAELFIKEVVRLHGFPTSIVSDRDRLFMSAFWAELFKEAGTKLKMTTAYHPQSDGQTEAVNKCVETYLRCLTGTKPKQGPKWLSWAEYWYDTNYHGSIKMTPFKALYGRDPPILQRGVGEANVDEVQLLMQERNQMLEELRVHLNKAQQRMKLYADKKRREVEFQPGDKVYLKIQPYRMKSLAKKINQKLSPRFYGPFEVLERIGQVAYKLQLPEQARVHPVFHVSLLKACIKPDTPSQNLPAALTEDWELQVQPEKVLAVRRNNEDQLQILLKWQDLPEFENSWELASEIQQVFPSFHLEDKVLLEGEGIVTPLESEVVKGSTKRIAPLPFHYSRKHKEKN